MRVILRADVDDVGNKGDIVDVADGYARNFLLPEGWAMKATPGAEAQAATMRRSREHQGRGRSRRRRGDRHAARAHHDHDHGPGGHRGPAVRLGRHRRGGRGGRKPRPASSSTASRLKLDEPIKDVGTHQVPGSSTPTWSSPSPSRSAAGDPGRPRRPALRTDVVTAHGRGPARVPSPESAVPTLSPGCPQGCGPGCPQPASGKVNAGMATQRTDDDGRGSRAPAGRVPPHNLEAEESLLGAMLLSTRRGGRGQRGRAGLGRLLPAGARAHLRRHHRAHRPGRARSTRSPWPTSCAAATCSTRSAARRPCSPSRPNAPGTANAAHYARIVSDHALLRRLIGAAGTIAEHGATASPTTCARRSTRPSRWCSTSPATRARAAPPRMKDLLDETLDRIEELYDRGAAITGTPTGYYDLDEHDLGPPARRPGRRRRPPRHGQDRVRPRHGHPRGHEGPQAGARVLPRDEQGRAEPAHPLRRGPGRLEEGPQRQAHRQRLGGDHRRRSAGWPRRRSGSTTTRTST